MSDIEDHMKTIMAREVIATLRSDISSIIPQLETMGMSRKELTVYLVGNMDDLPIKGNINAIKALVTLWIDEYFEKKQET